MSQNIFTQDLPRTEANFAALTPLAFLERTALVYPDRLSIVHGALRQTWGQTYSRCRRLASALHQRGIERGHTVAVMLPNTPPMVEAHFGIPMAGAVLNTLNTRLDAEALAFMLDHGEARAIIVDRGEIVADGTPDELKKKSPNAGAVVLTVRGAESEGVKERLGQLGTVDTILILDDSDTITVKATPKSAGSQNELASNIADSANQAGWRIEELRTEEGKLDEVFRTITKPDTAKEAAA